MKNIYGPIRGKCPIHTDTISNYNLIIKVSSNFYLPALTHILILQNCGKLGRRGRVGWVGWAGLGQIINKRQFLFASDDTYFLHIFLLLQVRRRGWAEHWAGWAGLGQIINKRPPRPIITERRLDGTAALSFFAEIIVANLGISSCWQ